MTTYAPQPIIDTLQAHLESLNPRPAAVEFFREDALVAALEWAAMEGRWQLVVRKEQGGQVTRRPLAQLSADQQRAALGAFFELMMLAASETAEQPPAVAEALATLAQSTSDSGRVRRAFFG